MPRAELLAPSLAPYWVFLLLLCVLRQQHGAVRRNSLDLEAAEQRRALAAPRLLPVQGLPLASLRR